MDKLSKMAFLTVFIIPISVLMITAWLLLGDQIVQGGITKGYLDGLSIMIIPTLFVIGLGIAIKHIFFK